jgi:hypothetical protein
MKHKTKQPPIELLLQILDEGYEKRTWTDPI